MAARGFSEGGRRYVPVTAKAHEIPNQPPLIPMDIVEFLTNLVTIEEAPFLLHISNVQVEWLQNNADRLGNTRFESPPHELDIRRRKKLPPGLVTIGLHPILFEDEALYRHTLAHELLHAVGLISHDSRHAELVHAIAPSPKLSDSAVLREIREQALAQQEVQSWTCNHCTFTWGRTTIRTPSRCPKCARPFK